jgi:Na+/melibiose symporter-like transporter
VLVYALLWWIPPLQSQVWPAVYYGVAFVLYDTVATVIYMPYFALAPELTRNYDERTTLTNLPDGIFQHALQALLEQPAVVSLVVGVKRLEQLEAMLAAVE